MKRLLSASLFLALFAKRNIQTRIYPILVMGFLLMLINSCIPEDVPVIAPVLTTTELSNLTYSGASSGGNIISEGGATVTARGVCWSTETNPTIDLATKTIDGTGAGSFTSSISGLTPFTNYYVRAYATNSAGTAYGNEISFTSTKLTDASDNTYNTVTIGTQVWMKENLKTTKYNDGTDIPNVTDNAAWAALTTPGYCWYNNDYANFGVTYGALYNWYVVDPASNGGKNVCPTGWHVPSDAEWYTLENYVDPTINDPNAIEWRGIDGGTKLKASSGWNTGGNGTDNYGFRALPSAARADSTASGVTPGLSYGITDFCGWWSSTLDDDASTAWNVELDYRIALVHRWSDPYTKQMGFSVRCVKD